MVKTEISQGGEAFIFNLLASGSVTDPAHTQHLLHGRGQSLCPTTRPLQKGDLIITEFHTSYGGYLTGCEKSVYIGNHRSSCRGSMTLQLSAWKRGYESSDRESP